MPPRSPPATNVRTKFPGKRQSAATAAEWTSGMYTEMCRYMRGNVTAAAAHTLNVIKALTAYMKHSALVAPATPASLPRPAQLWRGVRGGTIPNVGDTVEASGGCFVSFSVDRRAAEVFACGMMYRLRVDRIARGTPWVWFFDRNSYRDGLPPRWKQVVQTAVPGEQEVLLPPGYLKVLRISTEQCKWGHPLKIIDVAFIPHPEYVRRGAVPRLNDQGRAVTRSVGGNRLVTNAPSVARAVKARRDRMAHTNDRR